MKLYFLVFFMSIGTPSPENIEAVPQPTMLICKQQLDVYKPLLEEGASVKCVTLDTDETLI